MSLDKLQVVEFRDGPTWRPRGTLALLLAMKTGLLSVPQITATLYAIADTASPKSIIRMLALTGIPREYSEAI